MKRWQVIELGSGKSGHWGHAGRKGHRGGSMARSVAMSIRTGRDWKERQAAKGKKKFGTSGVSSVEGVDPRNKGINDSYIMTFEDGTKGIFKKEDMEHGSMEGEILAYELSKSLGWDIVPETIEYTYGGVRGSLQKWVPDAEVAVDYKGDAVERVGWGMYAVNNPTMQRDYDRMLTLDKMLNNGDRHGGNWLVGKDRLSAIDNGGAFGAGMGGKKAMRVVDYDPTLLLGSVADEVRVWAGSPAAYAFTDRVYDLLGTDYGDSFDNFVGRVQ